METKLVHAGTVSLLNLSVLWSIVTLFPLVSIGQTSLIVIAYQRSPVTLKLTTTQNMFTLHVENVPIIYNK